MVDLALQSRILSLLRDGQGAVVEAAPDRPGPPRDWSVGQVLAARVDARLPDGRALLDVDGVVFQVKLPERAEALQVGQRLSVTVVRTGTQPTFLLQTNEAQTEGPAGSSRVSLSPLASRVAAVLAGGTGVQAGPVTEAKPLVPAPVTTGAALVAPLKAAFETSGMFYESHQAEWVGGNRPLEALRQEPQARLAREAETSAALQKPTGPSLPDEKPAGDAVTALQPSRSAEASSPAQTLAPAVAGLVDRQLDAIATQQIAWSGQIWPGQTLHWQVEERGTEGGGEEEPPQWRTQLRLALPLLGSVTAQLDLRGERLNIVIEADGGTSSAAALRHGEIDLKQALEARGLRLGGFLVRDGDT
ncbi:MAG: flagellar hook-length control protein FliK [Betaproteobacteria bacterium]